MEMIKFMLGIAITFVGTTYCLYMMCDKEYLQQQLKGGK